MAVQKLALCPGAIEALQNIDYEPNLRPDLKMIRLVMSDAAEQSNDIGQIDIAAAFLQARCFKHEVFVKLRKSNRIALFSGP